MVKFTRSGYFFPPRITLSMTLFGYKLFWPLQKTLLPTESCLGDQNERIPQGNCRGRALPCQKLIHQFPDRFMVCESTDENSGPLGYEGAAAIGSLTAICFVCHRAVSLSGQCFHLLCIFRHEGRFYLNWVELEEFLTVTVTLLVFINIVDIKCHFTRLLLIL